MIWAAARGFSNGARDQCMSTHLDKLSFEIRILHVGRRQENKHEGEEIFLRSLGEHVRRVSVARAEGQLGFLPIWSAITRKSLA